MAQVVGKAVGGKLALDCEAGAAHAGAGRVAALDHEARDDAVEDRAVVKAVLRQLHEVGYGVGRDVGIQFEMDLVAVFHGDGDGGIGHLGVVRLAELGVNDHARRREGEDNQSGDETFHGFAHSHPPVSS